MAGKKRGRPRKGTRLRSSQLRARATRDEKAALAAHCAAAGTTESDLIRARLSDVLSPPLPKEQH